MFLLVAIGEKKSLLTQKVIGIIVTRQLETLKIIAVQLIKI